MKERMEYLINIIPGDFIGYHFEPDHKKREKLKAFTIVKKGDLLRNKGDILLCPVGPDFVISNPLYIHLMLKEGKELKKWLSKAMSTDVHYRSENAIFLPLRKLKYRGVIFVAVDFHASDRETINRQNMAEAFRLAQQVNCCRLTVPANPFYSKNPGLDPVLASATQYADVLLALDNPITFNLELIVRDMGFLGSMEFTHHWKSISEREPYTAKLHDSPLTARRKPRMNPYSPQMQGRLRHILTRHSPRARQLQSALKTLQELGKSYDTGLGRGHIGCKEELALLLQELPWNKDIIERRLDGL